MQFLKTLFWVVLAVSAVIFSMHNWTQATINLWGGLQLDVKLPVLMIGSFLVGLVPTFVLHRATRWSLRRRLESAERALADLHLAGSAGPVDSFPAAPPPPPAPVLP